MELAAEVWRVVFWSHVRLLSHDQWAESVVGSNQLEKPSGDTLFRSRDTSSSFEISTRRRIRASDVVKNTNGRFEPFCSREKVTGIFDRWKRGKR